MPITRNITLHLGALVLALMPHIPRLPLWVICWCLVAWGYILLVLKYRLPMPSRFLRLVLAIGAVAGVLLTSGFSLDRYSSLALLWLMASIKPMEIRTYRDEMVTILLIYFLLLSNLFFSSSLAVGLYLVFSILAATAVLIHIHQPNSRFSVNLGMSATMMLKAVPLALILFVIFPRIQGSVWGLRSPATARTGFSDRLAPGSVTELVRSSDIAFRVAFDGRIPVPDRLYWRGLVFWVFDGRTWQPRKERLRFAAPLKGSDALTYTVTLEPHNQRWLFALDLPYRFVFRALLLQDYTLTSRWIVRQRIQYRTRSYLTYNTGRLRQWEPETLQLPRGSNPQALALARNWRDDSNSPSDVVNTALRYFQGNQFSYTLNPPPLGNAPIDEFLFKTRKGYCEHYASAFAFLMRAAGVPARIVAGYQGGELNPYGKYLIVRQSNAHVWVEVWLPDQGWVRIDPTLSIAPKRARQGAAAALPPEERSTLETFSGSGQLARYWLNLGHGWDAINNQWNKWVLGYSDYTQKVLLNKIGMGSGTRVGLAGASALGLGLIGLLAAAYFFRFTGKFISKTDEVQRAYLKFCGKLDRIGLVRRPFQGPLDFSEMVIAARQDLKNAVGDIISLYVGLRYGHGGSRDDLRRLRVLVRQFRP